MCFVRNVFLTMKIISLAEMKSFLSQWVGLSNFQEKQLDILCSRYFLPMPNIARRPGQWVLLSKTVYGAIIRAIRKRIRPIFTCSFRVFPQLAYLLLMVRLTISLDG